MPLDTKATFAGDESTKATFKEPLGPYILLEDGSGVILMEDSGKIMVETVPSDETHKASFGGAITTKATFDGT